MINTKLLAQKLTLKRLLMGMTKTEMAEQFNLTQAGYALYENGKIPERRAKEVCDFLGINLEDILEKTDD